jgi:short-subunit dehydrogenase
MFVITGASDGLGLELAKQVLAKGKRAVSLSRSQPPMEGIEWVRTDLMDEASIDNAVRELLAQDEPIEVLVNCAGITTYEGMGELTSENLVRMFKVNAIAPMLLVSGLFERLKQDGTDIVNVSSTIVRRAAEAKQDGYAASKWALHGFSNNLSAQLKETPCRVVNFIVGGFNSQMHAKVTGKPIADPENWMRPEDIAAFMLQILELPKNMEIGEVVVNRKARR